MAEYLERERLRAQSKQRVSQARERGSTWAAPATTVSAQPLVNRPPSPARVMPDLKAPQPLGAAEVNRRGSDHAAAFDVPVNTEGPLRPMPKLSSSEEKKRVTYC